MLLGILFSLSCKAFHALILSFHYFIPFLSFTRSDISEIALQSSLTSEHPASLIQSRLQMLEEELSYLKRAEALIRRGDASSTQLEYSY